MRILVIEDETKVGCFIKRALEEESYPLDELIYDLANLDGGFRFCGEDNRWAGRMAIVCHERYGLLSVAGYLENGVPPKYGSGAEQVVASVHKNPLNKHLWVTDLLGAGDARHLRGGGVELRERHQCPARVLPNRLQRVRDLTVVLHPRCFRSHRHDR